MSRGSRSREGPLVCIALLRGINVGGSNKIPMADLRSVCEQAGFAAVQTHIQSGNVVCICDGAPGESEDRLKAAIGQRFGFTAPVLVRSARQWSRYVESNPFMEIAQTMRNWRTVLKLDALARVTTTDAGADIRVRPQT